nr:hypothetical protein FFPRI1PSEUD_29340 [Pseudomonas sp. FFPRI_1]
MQGLATVGAALQRPLHSLDLTENAPDPFQQLIFLCLRMRHTYTPYTYMRQILRPYLACHKSLGEKCCPRQPRINGSSHRNNCGPATAVD